MFLQWVTKCELVPGQEDSHVLKKFSEKCQRGMCAMVVGFLGPDGVDLADVLPSAHHVRWAMEVLGHAFALPMDDADVILGSLRIYDKWLGLDDKAGKDLRPACMQKVEQAFIQDLLGQMTLLFEERTAAGGSSNGSVSVSDTNVAKQVSLCAKVLDTFDALSKRRGAQLAPQTWDRLIRLLLGAADAVLHNLRNVLGSQLCGQAVRILFEVYLRSLQHCGPRGELWGLLQKFCRRWIHRTMVIEQWNSVTLALTKSMMRQINGSDPSKDVEIIWADNRLQSTFELESPQIAYAWYRMLRVIGHPSAIFDADVYLAAIKGISRLADEFSRVEQMPRVKWEQVLGALNSDPSRDGSIFQAVTNGDEYDRDLRDVIIKGDKSTTAVQSRAPPDVNTILRLVGPWLFDACLTRKPRFAAGRSEALRCLGKLLCHFSTGRAKRINWAYGIRSLMALQNALLDDDERIAASAIFNWSKIFSLYGNHTLRGAGVMTGPFHKAIERMFRVSEQRKDSPTSRSDVSRRGGDPFFSQDAHSIGGIPIVLLRRACIEASSSLLTLHAHIPRNLIAEAESETVAPAMADIPGLYGSLPKYTSSNVISMLMNAMKTEGDPTNQQMIMWILTVAIQQEAAFWTNGLSSSRNSQVPFTILMICSVISKSTKYKAPVIFTAFDCLRHLSLVCDELFFHHTNSVVHLVNACCDFITNSAPILRSSRVPFYLDGLMASAYQCIIEWIVAAPLLLGKQQVIGKIITTVVDGNERIQSFASKNTAFAVRQAAQKLVNMLMKHHIAQTSNSGALAHSSPLTERTILSQFCGYDLSDNIHQYCRFFSVNKNSVLTVIEKPDDTDGGAETIVVMRDSTGRYVWRSKPRYRDGPRPKTLTEFENFQEIVDDDDSDFNTETSDFEVDEGEMEEEPRVADPLLSAIRDTQGKAPMMSWKSSNPSSAGLDADLSKVLPNEGNTGVSSMAERKAQAAGRDEMRTTQDAVFTQLLTLQTKEDNLSYRSAQMTAARCAEPKPPRKDETLEKWEVSRRMMSEVGFLSVRNWGSVFAMDASSSSFARDLEAIDKLADRETFEMAVAYVISRPSLGGYDKIHIVDTVDVRSGAIELSKDYELFLASMGDQIDQANHTGFSGSVDPELVNGRMLYHSHYSYEACFYVPTMPLEVDDPDPESMPLLERTNVLIVWNESQQTYRPGSVLWETAFKLPMPTSGVVLIIDPLGNDLYCVRVCYETSPLFNQRDAITNEEDTYMDEGEIFTARVLGPLLDGMVVNGAWLAPLVRQTAVNAAMLSRAFHRYQHDIGAISSSPLGAEAKRGNMISTFVENYMRPKLPGEFYGDLFAGFSGN